MNTKEYTIEVYDKDDRQTWLAKRGFGGSSVSALLGKNKYMTAVDIYCSAVNPTEHKNENATVSTSYGRNAEPILAKLFELDYPKYKLYYPEKIEMARRVDKPYITYTYDGLLEEIATGRKGFVEFKTHEIQNHEDEEEWLSGNLPEQYYIQVLQGFCAMYDKDFCELYAKLYRKDYETDDITWSRLLHFRLDRTAENVEADIQLIEDVQTDFQVNNIEKRIPPNIHIEF